jgi:hypothetical protein
MKIPEIFGGLEKEMLDFGEKIFVLRGFI